MHYITIADKEYPVSFGAGTLYRYERETGKSITQIAESPYSNVLDLSYYAFQAGARKARQAFDLSMDEFLDLLDEEPNAFDKLTALFNEAMPAGAPDETPEEKKAPPEAVAWTGTSTAE